MSYDFERELRDLGEEPHAHGGSDLALDAVLSRVHRGRALRTTTYGVVGVAAAAVIAVGGIAGVQQLRPAPVPPATTPTAEASPTTPPTATPAPSPTTSATAAPSWQPRWDWCGGVVNDDAFYIDAGGFWLQPEGDGGQVSADPSAPFTTSFTVRSEAAEDQVVDARVVGISAATFAPEGFTWTIAGVEAARLDASTHGLIPAGGGLPLSADVQLTSCDASPLDGGDAALTALPPDGYYDLLASVEVTTADGTTATVFGHLGQWIGTEPDGWNDAEQPTTAEGARNGDNSPNQYPTSRGLREVGIPSCREPYAIPASTDGLTIAGSATAEPGRVSAALTLANAGLDVDEGTFSRPILTLTKDGVVVAQTPDNPDGPLVLVNWRLGDSVQRTVSLDTVQCDPASNYGSGALPSGEYQLWALTSVQLHLNRDDGTTWGAGADNRWFYGGPWTVTITNG